MDQDDRSDTLLAIRRRSLRSVLSLGLRGGLGKIVGAVSLVLLSRFLAPADFGIFALMQLPLAWLNLVGDAGIATALITRPAIDELDEQVGFSMRLGLALLLAVAFVAFAPVIGRLYDLPPRSVYYLRLLALGPAIGALGTVSSIRLTRTLRFDKLALAELGSLIAGQTTAVFLAFNGAGLASLVAGALVSAGAGSTPVIALAPWRPRLAFATPRARALLRFGLLYQGQGLVHLAKDQAMPALAGLYFSAAHVGYLSWSQDIARWPRLPADYVARVALPAFARLQADPADLSRLLQMALTAVCTLSLALVAIALALLPALIGPLFGPAWLPASPALVIFLLQTPLDALAAVLLPVIYATGLVERGLALSAVWLAVTWAACLATLAVWGDWRGLPLAFGLATAVATLLIVRQLPPGTVINWRSALGVPLALALPTYLLAYLVRLWWLP